MPEDDKELREIELETAKIKQEIAKEDVRKFREQQADRERITRIRVIAVEKEAATNRERQEKCLHKTGGKGRQGFLRGDGRHGYCVGTLVLPTKEVYYLCSRCQKEWHHPMWVVKMQVYATGKTTVTKAQWDKMLKEYSEASQYDHPYTEMTEASLFNIPLLDKIDVSKIPLAEEARA
jgi:hypothetical protein